MKIINADISQLWLSGKIICVTTNGFIKKNGEAVMGRGNALVMSKLISDLPKYLGDHLKRYGNNVGFIYNNIIAFPVKPTYGTYEQLLDHIKPRFKPTDKNIPGFWCKADLSIIKNSLHNLNNLINYYQLKEIYLPVPGIGNGGISFSDVEHLLSFANNEIIFIQKNT